MGRVMEVGGGEDMYGRAEQRPVVDAGRAAQTSQRARRGSAGTEVGACGGAGADLQPESASVQGSDRSSSHQLLRHPQLSPSTRPSHSPRHTKCHRERARGSRRAAYPRVANNAIQLTEFRADRASIRTNALPGRRRKHARRCGGQRPAGPEPVAHRARPAVHRGRGRLCGGAAGAPAQRRAPAPLTGSSPRPQTTDLIDELRKFSSASGVKKKGAEVRLRPEHCRVAAHSPRLPTQTLARSWLLFFKGALKFNLTVAHIKEDLAALGAAPRGARPRAALAHDPPASCSARARARAQAWRPP